MAYADVTKPIVIEVNKTGYFEVESHLRKVCFVSYGNTTLTSGILKSVDYTTYSSVVTKNTELEKKLQSFFAYAGLKSCEILETGSASLEASVNALRTYLNDNSGSAFVIVCPNDFFNVEKKAQTGNQVTKDENFSKLVNEWVDIAKENIFFLNVPATESLEASNNLNYFKNKKSVLLAVDNLVDSGLDTSAVLAGKFANAIFDISDSNPASSLNYKLVEGTNPTTFNQVKQSEIINTPASFIANLAGQNVILGGLCADGYSLEYYYYWYLTKYRINNKLTSLLLAGSNNPSAAVRFNQSGIDTIKACIIAELERCKSQGVVTNYAQSYDTTMGVFTGLNDIIVPSYNDYIKNYYADYAKEILKGISFYLQIGKFIRQIQIFTNLGV